MSKVGKKLLAAAQEAVDCAKSLRPYARLTFNGHTYVPMAELDKQRAITADMLALLDDMPVKHPQQAERREELRKRLEEMK